MPVGQQPPPVTLDGEKGERVSGGAWSSDELVGSIHILFYVDPDESDLNNAASEALKAADFDKQQFRSVAIINMDATWLPNVVIQMRLESKQEEYPRTVYVRDYQKVLVEQWNLADDSSDIVLFDRDGTVLFSVDGQLSDTQIQELLGLIRERMN
ncbi:MAG TPA: transcriptional regulator [Deltaproteobacteria bacterium]|nr:transcriptional regulator [Deltaproteobacteria bacterium]